MGKKIDYTGKRFGRLVGITPVGKNARGYVLWECRCDCGKKIIVSSQILARGIKHSCGCYRKNIARKIKYKGMEYSPIEFAKKFKLNINTVRARTRIGCVGDELIYGKYGQRRRLKYRDNDGTPINFAELSRETGVSRWGLMLRYREGRRGEELRKEPRYFINNHRKPVIEIEWHGEKKTLSEIADELHIKYLTAWQRYKKGCFGEPKRKGRKGLLHNIDGQLIDFKTISERYDIPLNTLRARYWRGYRNEDLIIEKWGRRTDNVQEQM